MSGQIVYPRIGNDLRDLLIQDIQRAGSREEARRMLDFRLSGLNFRYPSLHQVDRRTSPEMLAELCVPIRDRVRELISNHDTGYGLDIGVKFDSSVATVLHQSLPMTQSQANDPALWATINTAILGDLLFWRWADGLGQISSDRYDELPQNLARSAFSRLWHRVNIFGPEIVSRFEGEVLDQILERPTIREDATLAKAIIRAVADALDSGQIENVQVRNTSVQLAKRMLRCFASVRPITLSVEAKESLVAVELVNLLR